MIKKCLTLKFYKMEKNSKIYIAGHTGLVGSAIVKKLKQLGYTNLVFSPHSQYDLRDDNVVKSFFDKNRPEYVILAAAKVGGIWANSVYRAEFIYDNLMIQSNIIHNSYLFGVKKLLFLGSSCIYPKNAPQPIKENYLLTGALEFTNEPYAIAKIAGLKMIESYNLQYGTNYIAVMPTNLYGPNDNYDLEKSHVLPALIRKMYLATCLENNDFEAIRADFSFRPQQGFSSDMSNQELVKYLEQFGIIKLTNKVILKLWGTGTPLREFLHSEDLADACVFLLEKIDFKDILEKYFNIVNPSFPFIGKEVRNTHINIGCGYDIQIKELANKIKYIVGFNGEIIWDKSKPDGTPRKLLDISRIKAWGWEPSIKLEDGIKDVFNHYLSYAVKKF